MQGDKLALVRELRRRHSHHVVHDERLGAAEPRSARPASSEGLYGPTWAPDGQSLAWGEPDGVWVKPSALD